MYLKYVFALLSAVAILWVITSCRSVQKNERSIDTLRVGIVDSDTIMFSVDGKEHLMIYKAEDKIIDEVYENGVLDQRLELNDFLSKNEPFVLKDVTIGKQFHWEKKEDQVFNGKLQVIAKEGKLHAINIIPIEEYLKSVISSEMSAMNNLELLKAHTIISRSWVLRQVINSSQKVPSEHPEKDSNTEIDDSVERIIKFWDQEDHKYYDVCADDHCQRYQGTTRATTEIVREVINETWGEVLVSDGKICDARFSKCCGGTFEEFETCWEDKHIPYLESVDCPYCGQVAQRLLTDHRAHQGFLNDYDQETLNFHDWEVTYSPEELASIIREKSGIDFGDIIALTPLKRGKSGRICELEIVGTKRRMTIGKELKIRLWLSPKCLYSSWFDILRTGNGFRLQGHGWGHGAGLCQIGAAEMAQEGFSYRDILAHYYPNTELKFAYLKNI